MVFEVERAELRRLATYESHCCFLIMSITGLLLVIQDNEMMMIQHCAEMPTCASKKSNKIDTLEELGL